MVAFRINLPKVRIAFHTPGGCVDRRDRLPGCHRRTFGIERPTITVLKVRHPIVKPGGFRLGIGGIFGRVLGQELLEVVTRAVRAAVGLERAAGRKARAHRGTAGEDVDKVGIRFRELKGDGVIVHLFHHAVFAVDLEFKERRRHERLVQVHVLIPEHEIIGGERRAVRPLGALAQENRDGLAVIADFPVFRERGHDLVAGVIKVQDLVSGIDAVAILVIGGTGEGAAPIAAVLAGFFERLDDHEVAGVRQSLGHFRQFAGFDQIGEHRRFLERLGELRGLADDRWTFELANQRLAELGGGFGRGGGRRRRDGSGGRLNGRGCGRRGWNRCWSRSGCATGDDRAGCGEG